MIIALRYLLLLSPGLLYNGNLKAQSRSHEIAFVSDTQAPMWIEKTILKENRNKEATALIFKDIENLRPQALFILGDVVAVGSKKEQWKKMDGYLKAVRQEGTPIHALLGNHDIMFGPKNGEKKFQLRFPDHQRLGNFFVVDSVGILLLNSNYVSLTEADRTRQNIWLKQTLDQIDDNPAILAAIVTCHHPPFTNSTIVGMNKFVQTAFVPPFIASKKAKLFATGHAHAFERFKVQGKNFLTIGGGGGLHQPLRTGEGALADEATAYKPEFHYLTMARNRHQLIFTSHALKTDFSGFETGYIFSIDIDQ